MRKVVSHNKLSKWLRTNAPHMESRINISLSRTPKSCGPTVEPLNELWRCPSFNTLEKTFNIMRKGQHPSHYGLSLTYLTYEYSFIPIVRRVLKSWSFESKASKTIHPNHVNKTSNPFEIRIGDHEANVTPMNGIDRLEKIWVSRMSIEQDIRYISKTTSALLVSRDVSELKPVPLSIASGVL